MSSFIFATLASSYALNFTIALLGLWLLWYVGKFSLLPLLFPDEPKEYPYYIPDRQ